MKSIIFAALLASCSTLAHAQDAIITYPGATLAPGGTSTANSGSSALNPNQTPGGAWGAGSSGISGPQSMINANPDSAVKSGVIQDTTSTLSLSKRR